jgi:hypothetical protein
MQKESSLEMSQFASINTLPIFTETIAEYDYEIYELIIDYTEPTFRQLQAIKDSLGDNPYNLLNEQIQLHHIFLKALDIQNTLREIEYLSRVIPYSTDYSSNTKILKLMGSSLNSAFIQDSLLITQNFDATSGSLATLKTKYDRFNTKLSVFKSDDDLKKLVQYKFEGTQTAQKRYWDSIIKKNKNELPIFVKSLNEFIKYNYSYFKDLSEYLKTKYPELSQFLNQ